MGPHSMVQKRDPQGPTLSKHLKGRLGLHLVHKRDITNTGPQLTSFGAKT